MDTKEQISSLRSTSAIGCTVRQKRRLSTITLNQSRSSRWSTQQFASSKTIMGIDWKSVTEVDSAVSRNSATTVGNSLPNRELRQTAIGWVAEDSNRSVRQISDFRFV